MRRIVSHIRASRNLRIALVIIGILHVLFAAALAITITDFHPDPRTLDPKPVDGSMPTEQILRNAEWNTYIVPHTRTLRVFNESAEHPLQAKWVHTQDPRTRQYYGQVSSRDDEDPTEWLMGQSFLTEHLWSSRSGRIYTSTGPPAVGVALPTKGSERAIVNGFDVYRFSRLASFNTTHLRTLRANESRIVLGVTTPKGYSWFKHYDHDSSEYRDPTANASYHIVIDANTGRVVRIVDRNIYTDTRTGRLVRESWTTNVTYENVTVTRPNWVSWHPLEVILDALVYTPHAPIPQYFSNDRREPT